MAIEADSPRLGHHRRSPREVLHNLADKAVKAAKDNPVVASGTAVALGVGGGFAATRTPEAPSAPTKRPGIEVAIPMPETTINGGFTIPSAPPTTEAPTTTIPEVFQSAEGQLLKRFGYNQQDAESIMGMVRQIQAQSPEEPVLEDIGGADRLRLIDMPFNAAGAQEISNYVGAKVASGYTTTLNFDGIGEATFKMVPLASNKKEAVLVIPVNAPLPPAWVSDFNYTDTDGKVKRKTSTYGSTKNGMTVIQVDIANRAAAYQVSGLEMTEGFMRRGVLKIVSREGITATISDSDLEQVAREVEYNREGRIGGMKMTGYPEAAIQAFVNGTDGKNGDRINVHTWPKPLKIPPYDRDIYVGAPGPKDRPWG